MNDLFDLPAGKIASRQRVAGPKHATLRLPADELGRQPPHSVEAERAVLGSVLAAPSECVPECVQTLKGNRAVFYDERHRLIFESVLRMAEKRQPIDVVTLQQNLRDAGLLEAIGGLSYLSQLNSAVISPANLGYYLEIVRQKFLLRKLLHVCLEAEGAIYEDPEEVHTLLDRVEQQVLAINDERYALRETGMKELSGKAIEKIEQLHSRHGQLTGLASGFHDLDKLTDGFHGGEMIVIAARPSCGKTSLAMNIAEHVALDLNRPVGVFSLEMSAESLVLRLLCARARVGLGEIRGGFLPDEAMLRLCEVSKELARAPLFIDDTSGLTILELRAKARRMKQKHQVALLVVDYIQLLRSDSFKVENRQQEIADIAHGLKDLAKELNLPILVLAQLNRQMDMAADKTGKKRKPQLSDLRESGAIEQDADLVGLLYKWGEEDAVKSGPPAADTETVHLLIAKHRNGPTGDLCLTFLRYLTRFESYRQVGPGDVPPKKH